MNVKKTSLGSCTMNSDKNCIVKFATLSFFFLLGGFISLHAEESEKMSTALFDYETVQSETIVKGSIKDADGSPLIGVNIMLKGTSEGTISDIDGNFSIEASVGQTIIVSYIGYETQTITLTSTASELNIVLKESSIGIDEVVVTALGIKRAQKALSYNVQELKGESLTGIKDVNFVNALTGKIAGVTINTSSAGIGGATRVVMRGSKSITKDNNALYVIDGMPIFNVNRGGLDQDNEYASQPRGEGISDLNPEDIERVSVLTGAAAAALYGSNAANGVIVITTKKGVKGKAKVTISNQTTFSRPFVLPDFQNRYGNRAGEYRSWGDKQSKYAYEPADFFNTGVSSQTNASLSVGSENNQTYMSLGNTYSNGIIPENTYRKNNATLRNTTKFLNDKMTLEFGMSYIKQKDQNMMAQGRYYNPLTAVYTYPRGEDFSVMKEYELYDKLDGFNKQQWKWKNQTLDMQNPYWVINRNKTNNQRNRYMMNVGLSYDLFDWLNVLGRARLDNSENIFTHKKYASTDGVYAGEKGGLKETKESYKQGYADLLLNIDKQWDNYSFSANIGASISDIQVEESGANGDLLIPNFFSLSNIDKGGGKTALIKTGWHEQTQSVFANMELGWRSMLYLTLTGRNDWSSALANTNTKSFFYPSVGLSGVITEMVDMPDFVSYLKVRASYSSVGSPIPRNLSIATYGFDAQGGYWQTNSYKPLDELRPERTGSWEVGLSSKFWNNALSFDLTWYKTNTKNQTFNIPISASSRYSSMYVQTGNVENQGIELSLGANLTSGNFAWSPMFTASYNHNEIKQLVEDNKFKDDAGNYIKGIEVLPQGGIGSVEFRLTKGGTMGDLWTKNRLKKNEDGTVVLAENGSPVTEESVEKAGSVLPKWNLGFSNDFSYKNVTLGVLISARLGGIVASHTQAYMDGFGVSETTAAARDKGGVFFGDQMIDAEKYYTTVGQSGGLMSDYIYKATNVRLQELSLGYNLPANWFNDKVNVHLSLVGRNLWMIYNKAPFDPEATASTGTYFQGIDYFMQPSQRNIGFNVRVNF